MAQNLHITFKAGLCEVKDKSSADGQPRHVKPLPTQGYIYLFTEDDLLHFCWRPRSAPMSEPEVDLIMFAGDGTFKPYQSHGTKHSKVQSDNSGSSTSITNGRLYVLSFSSSSDRYFFWLQSKSQSPSNDPSYHSPRDLKIAEVVNKLLAGEDVNAQQEVAAVSANGSGPPDPDGDTAMEDDDPSAPGDGRPRGMSGGAGADATGGDIREEGEESREGGADGGRANAASSNAALSSNPEAQAAISNFLQSLQGGGVPQASQAQQESKPFPALADLLTPETTIATLASVSESQLNSLLSMLPPTLIMLATDDALDDSLDAQNPDAETLEAITMSLSTEQKREVLTKVLRSPQFVQSLASLTAAIADGGLPTISEALKVPVENSGYAPSGGGMPITGGEAINSFVRGVRKRTEEEDTDKEHGDERMDVG